MAAIPILGHRFTLKEILFICCGLLVLVVVVQADYDDGDYGSQNDTTYRDSNDDYEYEEYGDEDYGDGDEDYVDPCDFHGSLHESHACHKDNLPRETMEDLFGKNVRKCCKGHGYEDSISEDCKVSSKLIFYKSSLNGKKLYSLHHSHVFKK